MATHLEEFEKQLRALNSRDKAALALMLIEDLDSGVDEDVEALWLEEAQRRYDAYRGGEVAAIPGEEVMQRARARLR